MKIKFGYLIVSFFLFVQIGLAQNQAVIDSIEKVLLQTTDVELRVELLLRLSDEYLTSEPDKAKAYAENALLLSEKNGLVKEKVSSLIDLARISQTKTDLKNSINYAIQAKELASIKGFKKEYAEATLLIANSFTQLNDFTKSSNLCFEALELYEKIGDEKGTCDALNGIGIIYFEQKQYDKALEYFKRSLTIAEKLNDLRGISRGLNNTSNVYGLDKNNVHKSIKALEEAIEINLRTGQKLWLGINYSNLASYYAQIDKYDSAFQYVFKSIETYKELNNLLDLARSYHQLSEYYLVMENTKEFLFYAMLADSIGEAKGLKGVQFTTANTLQNYYLQAGDFEKAYFYKTRQYNLKDSIDTETSLTRLAQLELLYDLEKKEQEMKIQTQRKDFIIALSIVSLVALVIFSILLLFRYRIKVRYSNLEQQKLKNELEYKNKEMTANVMALMKKNEMLTDITTRLIDIEAKADREETKSSIRKVAIDIENSTQEKIWEEFELRFKQVHSAFYNKLNLRFPDLSPNEQRLCAFLKLNLTTKEISSITGQNARAIEMARFRLRKKLGISTQEINLVTFISQI
ncbi:MAG: tetratricopeptide repeat protein [Bacteroidales bacterium]|nr:tetratricopeptide repeat protein [Bacteroidales bacterium]MDD4177361.1 tetratricopeptide repeat protein [Bacteroidales bacterium]MDD4742660.1 tetratricopeptide repeat protein [Bacteroidales bacterium]MDY0335516.1 tetratricopeptide repeat protein [Bacteroidales bacterium]